MKKNVSKLARELGISAAFIYRWRKEYAQYRKGSFPSNSLIKMTPEVKELSDLKKRFRTIKMENDILIVRKRWASFPRAIIYLWIYQEIW